MGVSQCLSPAEAEAQGGHGGSLRPPSCPAVEQGPGPSLAQKGVGGLPGVPGLPETGGSGVCEGVGTGPTAQASLRRVPWGLCLCCPGCPVLGSAGHLASDISLVGGLVFPVLPEPKAQPRPTLGRERAGSVRTLSSGLTPLLHQAQAGTALLQEHCAHPAWPALGDWGARRPWRLSEEGKGKVSDVGLGGVSQYRGVWPFPVAA